MGPTVAPGINLHVGKKLAGVGPTVPLGMNQRGSRSHCTTRKELARRNCEIGKKLVRNGSHCATKDEFACRKDVWQPWVPLYHLGGNTEEADLTVPPGKNYRESIPTVALGRN